MITRLHRWILAMNDQRRRADAAQAIAAEFIAGERRRRDQAAARIMRTLSERLMQLQGVSSPGHALAVNLRRTDSNDIARIIATLFDRSETAADLLVRALAVLITAGECDSPAGRARVIATFERARTLSDRQIIALFLAVHCASHLSIMLPWWLDERQISSSDMRGKIGQQLQHMQQSGLLLLGGEGGPGGEGGQSIESSSDSSSRLQLTPEGQRLTSALGLDRLTAPDSRHAAALVRQLDPSGSVVQILRRGA